MSRKASPPKAESTVGGEGRSTASLTQRAYEALRDKILTLHFLPGQYLNESTISQALQLGRTPVHQALQRLQQEGLVAIVPRKGILIEPDSIAKILEVLDARAVIEPELVRAATRHVAGESIAALERVLERDSSAHGGGAIEAFVELDREFHGVLTDMSGNRILGEFAKTLHDRSARYWQAYMWQTFDPKTTARQHRRILDALAAGNAQDAADAMRDHILDLRSRLVHLQANAPRRLVSPG